MLPRPVYKMVQELLTQGLPVFHGDHPPTPPEYIGQYWGLIAATNYAGRLVLYIPKDDSNWAEANRAYCDFHNIHA